MYTYLTDWSKLVHGYVIRRIDKLRGMIVYVFHVDRHRQVRRNLRAKTLKCAARATASSLYPSHLILHGIPPLDAYTFHTRLFLVARIALFEIGTNQLSQLATKKEFIRVLCRSLQRLFKDRSKINVSLTDRFLLDMTNLRLILVRTFRNEEKRRKKVNFREQR